jgi:curved DNA-binding protein
MTSKSANRAEITTAAQASALLGVARDAPLDVVRAAFRRAAKAAHPDRGGEPEEFRRVLDAYRLLSAKAPAASRAAPPPPPKAHPEPAAEPPAAKARPGPNPVLRISVAEAFLGAAKTVRLADGRRGKVKLPPGIRSGDIARFGPQEDQRIAVSIAPEPGAEVRGDDLWLTVAVSEEFIKSGGRMEVTTPFGKRSLWISRSSASRGLFRAPGEGLPATETRPRGHLYLRLSLDPALADTPAKSLLRRFAAAWAA